jgi:hypothetical protein
MLPSTRESRMLTRHSRSPSPRRSSLEDRRPGFTNATGRVTPAPSKIEAREPNAAHIRRSHIGNHVTLIERSNVDVRNIVLEIDINSGTQSGGANQSFRVGRRKSRDAYAQAATRGKPKADEHVMSRPLLIEPDR